MTQRDSIAATPFISLAGRILLPVCVLVSATAMAAEEQPQQRRPAQTADQAKGNANLCPVRWGKRPRRANGPGAVRYVAEWGPCKPGAAAVSAGLPSAAQPPQMR